MDKRFASSGSSDNYKTLQGAKAAFTKNYQSQGFGDKVKYPKPIWREINEYPF